MWLRLVSTCELLDTIDASDAHVLRYLHSVGAPWGHLRRTGAHKGALEMRLGSQLRSAKEPRETLAGLLAESCGV